MKEKGKSKGKKTNITKRKNYKDEEINGIIVYCQYSSSKKTMTDEQKEKITNILKGTIYEDCTTRIINEFGKIINEEYDKETSINRIKSNKELAELILTLQGDNIRIISTNCKCDISKSLAEERYNYYKQLFEKKQLPRKAINYEEARKKLLTDYDNILNYYYARGRYADNDETLNPDNLPKYETGKIQPCYRENPYEGLNNQIEKDYSDIMKNPEQWITDEMVEEYKNYEIFDCDTSEKSLRTFISGCDADKIGLCT